MRVLDTIHRLVVGVDDDSLASFRSFGSRDDGQPVDRGFLRKLNGRSLSKEGLVGEYPRLLSADAQDAHEHQGQ